MCCNNYAIPISVTVLILSYSNNLRALTTVSHTVNMVLLCLHVQNHRHERSSYWGLNQAFI